MTIHVQRRFELGYEALLVDLRGEVIAVTGSGWDPREVAKLGRYRWGQLPVTYTQAALDQIEILDR